MSLYKYLERTTASIRLGCSKCGTIPKSGKMSCCARGGSWFKNCGGAGNTKLQHTWYEGIQACKEQEPSMVAVRHRQQNGVVFSHGGDKVNSEAVISSAQPSKLSSANMSTQMADGTSIITGTADSTSAVITSTEYTRPIANSKITPGVASRHENPYAS